MSKRQMKALATALRRQCHGGTSDTCAEVLTRLSWALDEVADGPAGIRRTVMAQTGKIALPRGDR